MKWSKTKKCITGVALSLVLISGGLLIGKDEKKNMIADADTLFSTTNVQTSMNVTADESLGFNDARTGTMMTATQSGSSFVLGENMCGAFELDFRIISEGKYSAGTTLPYGNTVVNPALDLKTLTFRFDNLENGDSFDVVIEGGSCMNFASPQAYVRLGEEKAGLFNFVYLNNENLWTSSSGTSNTSYANANGRYATIYGTSFSNTAYQIYAAAPTDGKGSVEADTVSSLKLCFDPLTMEVYAKTVNTVGGSEAKTPIWNFANSSNDGRVMDVLDNFGKYNVSVEFSEIVANKTAKMLIYSMNGQSLGGETYANEKGANVFANYTANGIVGEKITLKKPLTYDVLGTKDQQVKVSAVMQSGNLPVYTANGSVTQYYSDGCYVIPNSAGKLTFTYLANDGQNGVPFDTSIEILKTEPQVQYTFSGALESGKYGVGTVLTLPEATVDCELFKVPQKAKVTVYKDGSVMSGYEQVDPCQVAFTEVGTYVVKYSCEGIKTVSKIELEILDTLPSFNYDALVPTGAVEGDTVTFPKCTTSLNGTALVSSLAITYPDGSVYGDRAVLCEEAGEYLVTYSTQVGTEVYKQEYTLVVEKLVDGFTSTGGAVSCGTPCGRYEAIQGILLKSEDTNMTYTYSKTINLADNTSNVKLLQMYSSDTYWGGHAGSLPKIRLTDVYDPNNYIEITTIYGWHWGANQNGYFHRVLAAAPNQTPKTMYLGESGNASSPWATTINWAVYAFNSHEMSYSGQGMSLSYDNETKCIYGNSGLITDFDATYQEIPWKGFTTGEVYLTISGITSATITVIDGLDVTGKILTDEVAPEIYVDVPFDKNNQLPKAVVGKEYAVYSVEGYDVICGASEVTTQVFYHYGRSYSTEFDCSSGAFTPTVEGTYTIVYTAKDSFGNTAVQIFEVEAVNESKITPVNFVLNGTNALAGTVGVERTIKEIDKNSFSGGTGNLQSEVFVTAPNGEITYLTGNSFIPTSTGKYVLTYRVFDYVGNGGSNELVKTSNFVISASKDPIIEEVLLPKAVLSGATVTIPSMRAVDYSVDANGVNVEDITVEATLNGSALPIVNGEVLPVVESGVEDMEICYSIPTSRGTVIEEKYQIKVINPGSNAGYMTNYFYSVDGGIGMDAQNNGILFTFSTDQTVAFINPVSASKAGFEISIVDVNKVNMDSLVVKLYDSVDRSIQTQFEISRQKDGDVMSSNVVINGKSNRSMSGSFMNTNGNLGLYYSQGTYSVQDASGKIFAYLDEEDPTFSGFPSGKVYVEFTFKGVTAETKIRMAKINNQPISNVSTDYLAPECLLTNSFSTLMNVGDALNIPYAIAQDVLKATSTVTIRVKKPNVRVSDSYENKDFVLTLDSSGQYTIYYDCKAGGRTFTATYYITVLESEAPTIEFNETIPTEFQVNTEYTLPTYTTTDNFTEECSVTIYVINENYEMSAVKGNKLTFTKAGTYTIRYFVVDECYNFIVKDFDVVVR